jgi:propanol-preferring alcohol dehydrogenase
MKAMVLHKIGKPLILEELDDPEPQKGEVRLKIEACAVCRTDLHVVDGDLKNPKIPLIPGHEIVGRVDQVGPGVAGFELDQRVGVPWLARTCGQCPYCSSGRENLCDQPLFTGYTRDGGFSTHVVADSSYVFDLQAYADPIATAPLMCAGLIGWRSLIAAGPAQSVGIYGFGAAAHIIAQVCKWQGRDVYAFTRPKDRSAQQFAKMLGAIWAGGSNDLPPTLLDAAIIFAPVGALIPTALKNIKKGGRLVCGGIHMSDIPRFPYRLLWEERQIVSVANLTRQDAIDFLKFAAQVKIKTKTTQYPLSAANEALSDLREGRFEGAAVLIP